MRTKCPSRQLDAVSGFIPVIAIACGGALGAALAEIAGLPVLAGVIVFSVLGFFASRFALRRYYGSQGH